MLIAAINKVVLIRHKHQIEVTNILSIKAEKLITIGLFDTS